VTFAGDGPRGGGGGAQLGCVTSVGGSRMRGLAFSGTTSASRSWLPLLLAAPPGGMLTTTRIFDFGPNGGVRGAANAGFDFAGGDVGAASGVRVGLAKFGASGGVRVGLAGSRRFGAGGGGGGVAAAGVTANFDGASTHFAAGGV
jgi:hypothetical protein